MEVGPSRDAPEEEVCHPVGSPRRKTVSEPGGKFAGKGVRGIFEKVLRPLSWYDHPRGSSPDEGVECQGLVCPLVRPKGSELLGGGSDLPRSSHHSSWSN